MSGPGKLCAAGAAPAVQLAHDEPRAPTCSAHADWQQDRLNEARGILADMAHHPDTLVVLACRVICSCRVDATEHADALGLMHLLNANHHIQRGRAAL